MKLNMGIFKALSHEAKVILSAVGSGLVVLASSPELLTMLISQPWTASLPVILPKLIASGTIGGSLFNMNSKKDEGKE